MPRSARASVGGVCYHIINRGNARREVFLKDRDYQAFLKAMGHACIEIPMPVLGFCPLGRIEGADGVVTHGPIRATARRAARAADR